MHRDLSMRHADDRYMTSKKQPSSLALTSCTAMFFQSGAGHHKCGVQRVGIITLPDASTVVGHVVLEVSVMNGPRVGLMQRRIAMLSGAAFE